MIEVVKFVLDASVALSWLLEDAGAGQVYANLAFEELKRPTSEAHVPATWALEIVNVIAKSEARGFLLENRSHAFLAALGAAPIFLDARASRLALSDTLELCRRYRLSSYDASYLELALRTALPLASLDQDCGKPRSKPACRFSPRHDHDNGRWVTTNSEQLRRTGCVVYARTRPPRSTSSSILRRTFGM